MAKEKVVAIIPIKGGAEYNTAELLGKPLISYTVDAGKNAEKIDKVIVSTDDEKVAKIAKKAGAEVPFIRPKKLSEEDKTVEDVLKYSVEMLEEKENYKADIVVLLEINHPFRKEGLLDKMIETMEEKDFDTVFVVFEEHDAFWRFKNGELVRISEAKTRKERKPTYRELGGLGCATKTEIVKKGKRLGEKIGIVPVRDKLSKIDIRNKDDLWLAEKKHEKLSD